MNFSPNFFKTVSLCAVIAGILLLALWILSFTYAEPEGLKDLIKLQDNTAYTTGQWIHFALLFLIVIVFWGVAAKKLDKAAGMATTGFIFFMINLIPNLAINSINIFTFNYKWASKFSAEDACKHCKALMMKHMSMFHDLIGGLLFLMIVCVLVGSFLYGMATLRGPGIEKIVGLLFLLFFLVELLFAIGMYGKIAWLLDLMKWWIFPIVGILLFLAIAAWLWRKKAEE